jgi:hypothetical protein
MEANLCVEDSTHQRMDGSYLRFSDPLRPSSGFVSKFNVHHIGASLSKVVECILYVKGLSIPREPGHDNLIDLH